MLVFDSAWTHLRWGLFRTQPPAGCSTGGEAWLFAPGAEAAALSGAPRGSFALGSAV